MGESRGETAGTVHVLHVDDDPDFTDLTATFLEQQDARFEVETATATDEGFDLLARADFDCVVSDYDMPARNGIEFLEAVREEYPDLPFILFTGKGSEEIASEAIAAGVTDYLQKGNGTDQYTVLANRIANAVEHAKSRRLLERSEQRLRDIVDALPHLVYVIDTDGTYLLANQTLAEFHGTTVADIEGSNIVDVLPDARAEELTERVVEVLEAGSMKYFPDVEIPDPHGEARTFSPRLLPYDFAATDRETVLGIVTDVTRERERKRSLERARERVDLALEHTNAVIFEIDFETGAVTRHGTYERFFNHRSDEVSTWQEHCENAVHPDDRAAFRRFHREFIDGDRTSGEIEYRTSPEEGDTRWIEAHVHLSDSTETDGQAVGISRDITEQKEYERDLERQNERLEEFTSVVSHDLRNPLNVVQGRLALAREECDSEHLNAMARGHERMETLIDELLTLSREGEHVTDPEPIRLGELVGNCWQNVDTADATLATETDRTVRADRSRLAQLIENLVRNAVEHGGDDVKITVGDVENGFYVEDTGPGIPEDERPHVFEAGYSTAEDGTGFGLSIVEQIVDAHGWDVRVTDGSDGGVRFVFTGVEFSTE